MIIAAKLARRPVPGIDPRWCRHFRRATDIPCSAMFRRLVVPIRATMLTTSSRSCVAVAAVVFAVASASPASGQSFESSGTRAQGMGGAFVAVADDATATWWNPAGLGGGAFLSAVIERGQMHEPADPPTDRAAMRSTTSGFAFAYPAVGLSYYRFRVSELGQIDSIGGVQPGRQDQRLVDPVVRSLSMSAFGITVGQSIGNHVIVASTLRLLRAGAVITTDISAPDPLERAEDLAVSRHTAGDLDLGVMLKFGVVSLGGTLKHVGEPGFGDGRERMVLARQGRAGVAVKRGKTGVLSSLVGAVDVDLTTRTTVLGDERRVAAGGELGLLNSRVQLRGGVSANTPGTLRWERSAGASVALRRGVYVDGAVAPESSSGASRTGWSVSLRTVY